MDVQHVGDRQRQAGEHGVHDVQRERNEHERELERSVTPVRNAVIAAAPRMPKAIFFCFVFAMWIMARAAAGRPNIRIG